MQLGEGCRTCIADRPQIPALYLAGHCGECCKGEVDLAAGGREDGIGNARIWHMLDWCACLLRKERCDKVQSVSDAGRSIEDRRPLPRGNQSCIVACGDFALTTR